LPICGQGRRRGRLEGVPQHHAAARAPGDRDRHPAVAHRRPALVRPHLGDDARRARLHARRHRVGHLQAVPGRLLRPVDRGQRRAVPRRHRDRGPDPDAAQPTGGRAMRNRPREIVLGTVAILASVVVFIVPFVFIFLTAAKTPAEAAEFGFSLPTEWAIWDNLTTVLTVRNNLIVRAFVNSTVITVLSVALMVVLAAMVGYVLQRRRSRWNHVVNFFVLAGLIVPPAVVPTIWVMQGLGLFKTIPGMIL